MGLLERVKDLFHSDSLDNGGQGIGNTAAGTQRAARSGRFDDDAATSRVALIIRSLQIFFLLIALFFAIAIASFQRSNGVGPSGLTGLDLFVIILSLLVTLMFVVVPVLHERKGWMKRIAQIIRQIRFGLISHVALCSLLLILAIANSISSNVAGCKNPDNDPNASVEGYKEKLGGFCRNKRALTAFLWFALFAWLGSLYTVVRQFMDVRRGQGSGARIPGFIPPEDPVFDASDEPYDQPQMGYAPPRMSGHYASDPDPAPVGYAAPTGYAAPPRPDPFRDPPQYGDAGGFEDPYDRIRQTLALRDDSLTPRQSTPPQLPPITSAHDPFRG